MTPSIPNPDPDPTHRCPTCGHEVVIGGDLGEGSHYMIPVEPGAHADASTMAVAIGAALRILEEDRSTPLQRAAVLGLLSAALNAHRERISHDPFRA
jgi:hypothetical protein